MSASPPLTNAQSSEHDQVVAQARAAHAQALALLRELDEAKAQAVSRDLYAQVTGMSALDEAIAQTRALVDSYKAIVG